MGQGLKTGIADNTMRKIDSDVYSKEIAYSVGQYCIYNNTLYKFIAEKSAGEWDESKVEKTSIMEELLSLSGDVNEIGKSCKYINSITVNAGESVQVNFSGILGAIIVKGISGRIQLYLGAMSATGCTWTKIMDTSDSAMSVELVSYQNGVKIFNNHESYYCTVYTYKLFS